ncbi:MAG: efflux RND transporter periplasmic adaptor subunit [Bacteroidota bacterium]
MKTRQIIILVIFLVVLGLIYFPMVNKEQKSSSEKAQTTERYIPIHRVQNAPQTEIIQTYGQVMGKSQFNVTMEVQGEIDRDNRSLKPGTTFRKNDILVKVDRVEALYNLLSRRSQFINLLTGVLPDITLDLPEQASKWRGYLEKVSPAAPLPDLPPIVSQKEKLLLHSRNVISEFYSIKASEDQIEKYIYVAPFNGVIVESFVEPGSMITPGMQLFSIAKTGDYEVKAPINIKRIEAFQNAEEIMITGAKDDTLGAGKFVRTAPNINTQTQSVDAYFSIAPKTALTLGAFVNLSIEHRLADSSAVVPEHAIHNKTVQVYKDPHIEARPIKILGSKGDSAFVSGLHQDSWIVLEPQEAYADTTTFIGIKR